jgi:hypothetical protein
MNAIMRLIAPASNSVSEIFPQLANPFRRSRRQGFLGVARRSNAA